MNASLPTHPLKTIGHVLMAIVIFAFAAALSRLISVALSFALPAVFISAIKPLLGLVLTIFGVNVYISKVLKLPLADFRICRPSHPFRWILMAVALPIGVAFLFMWLNRAPLHRAS